MNTPAQNNSHPLKRQRSKKQRFKAASSLVQHHHQDRGDTDDADDDGLGGLAHVRVKDLVDAKIISGWAQLKRLIDEQRTFPKGILLSPNVRVFAVAEVKKWLETRPVPTADTQEENGCLKEKGRTRE